MVGTNAPYLEIPSAKATDAGKYSCVILNNHGVASSMITTVEVRPEGGEIGEAEDSTAHLMNLSARARVGEGGDLLIGGLVVIEGPVRVLVRAAGPSLANMGITNPLKDPTITAFKGEIPIGTNDNWGDGDPSLAQIFSKVGASPYDSPTSKDAALLLTLNPGGYTFHVTGADGGTGVALLEIYLVPDPDLTGMIVNLSARAKVGAGENLLIGGVVVEGDAQGSILVRGVGPSLVTSGVTNPLTDPRLALFKADQQIGNADNWGTDYLPREMGSLFRRLGASELPSNSADAVKYLQVPSGGYTFQVTGKDGGEGVALIETYLVRPDWD